MPTIELPGGQTAEIADPDELTGFDVERAATLVDMASDFDPTKFNAGDLMKLVMRISPQLNRALATVMVRSWSLVGSDKEPLAVSMDALGGLSVATLRPIYAAVAEAKPLLLEAMGLGSSAGVPADPKSAPAS